VVIDDGLVFVNGEGDAAGIIQRDICFGTLDFNTNGAYLGSTLSPRVVALECPVVTATCESGSAQEGNRRQDFMFSAQLF
jgi:hypothetical protein